MPFHGTGSHAGAKQQASAQATRKLPIATLLASAVYTSEEMNIVGTPRQTVTLFQAAGGNPGLLCEVQYRIDAAWLTIQTFTIPVPGGPAITRYFGIAGSAMRVIITNAAGAPSGILQLRMNASH